MLTDKIAVITGGTRGIGFETAKLFLENNAKVVIFGSRQETVDNALDQLREINPDYPVEGFHPNLSNYNEISKVMEKIFKKYGKIDILINNAGITSSTPIDQYSVEDFEKIMDLNVNAMFRCIKSVIPHMKKNNGGVILNTSSMVTKNGQAAGIGYPTSKYAVNGLTISLSRELGPFNIRVNAVAPGVTDTDMVRSLPKNLIDMVISQVPLKRIGEPIDVANAFLFLASDRANYINGEILHVDGGCIS